MAHGDAASTLEDLEGLRRGTRAQAHASWIPFLVFGFLTLGAVPFAVGGEDGYDGYYWLVAGPMGCAATWLIAQHRGHELGLEDRRFRVYAAIIAAMVAGALAVGWTGGEGAFAEVGTLFPIAAGLLAIGAVSGSVLTAGAGAAVAAWGAGVLASDPDELAAWAYAGEGAVLLVAGLLALPRPRG
jgi:hypothetical protein